MRAPSASAGLVTSATPRRARRHGPQRGLHLRRVCNTNFPVRPGGACHELAGNDTQWLSVDAVRYGMCSGVGQRRSQYTKNPGAAEQAKPLPPRSVWLSRPAEARRAGPVAVGDPRCAVASELGSRRDGRARIVTRKWTKRPLPMPRSSVLVANMTRRRGLYLSQLVLASLVALAACGPAHHPPGWADCDPTAVSDNGCPNGQTCSLLQTDKATGERYLRCEPAGGSDEGEPCGKAQQCRPGHMCNITPAAQLKGTAEPGICVRLCNTNFPVCPGSSCHELSGGNTQWLSVDGVRYGMCSGVGHSRSQYVKD